MRRNYGYEAEENQAKDWNMNNAWHMEIMELWSQAHHHRQERNNADTLEAYWDALRSVWGMMLFDIQKMIIDKKDSVDDADVQKQNEIVSRIEKNFSSANNMFMFADKKVQGANLAAIKLLDDIELDLKYITGAIQYYKFRKEAVDMRYND